MPHATPFRAPIHEAARAGDIVHSGANVEKATNLLDFAPSVSFSEGLRRTVVAYRQAVE